MEKTVKVVSEWRLSEGDKIWIRNNGDRPGKYKTVHRLGDQEVNRVHKIGPKQEVTIEPLGRDFQLIPMTDLDIRVEKI